MNYVRRSCFKNEPIPTYAIYSTLQSGADQDVGRCPLGISVWYIHSTIITPGVNHATCVQPPTPSTGLPRGASLTFETLEIPIVPKIVCNTREYLFATLCIYYVNKSTTQRKNSKLIFLIEQFIRTCLKCTHIFWGVRLNQMLVHPLYVRSCTWFSRLFFNIQIRIF